MTMKQKSYSGTAKVLLSAILAGGLAGCLDVSGGSDGGGTSSGGGGGGGGGGTGYISWQNSDNGTNIIDASDEFFRAESSTGYITYTNGGQTVRYTNSFVNANGGDYYIDSIFIGNVTYIAGENNTTIMAFVCSNGQIMDFTGPVSGPSYTCNTGVYPVAPARAGLSARATADLNAEAPLVSPAPVGMKRNNKLNTDNMTSGDVVVTPAQ